MYHDVVGPEDGRSDIYSVTPAGFREQLDRIEELVGSPPQRADALSNAAGPWMLTFDDGGASGAVVRDENGLALIRLKPVASAAGV
jgi:hypothetical protein